MVFLRFFVRPHTDSQKRLEIKEKSAFIRRYPRTGGRGKIRTFVDISRQIYSLLPLTTRPPFHEKLLHYVRLL